MGGFRKSSTTTENVEKTSKKRLKNKEKKAFSNYNFKFTTKRKTKTMF